jgi:hypothetical protein
LSLIGARFEVSPLEVREALRASNRNDTRGHESYAIGNRFDGECRGLIDTKVYPVRFSVVLGIDSKSHASSILQGLIGCLRIICSKLTTLTAKSLTMAGDS